MPADHVPDTGLISGLLSYAASVLFAFLAFFTRRQVKRIDDIEQREKAYVSQAVHNDALNTIRKELQEGTRSTHERLDQLMLMMARGKKDAD